MIFCFQETKLTFRSGIIFNQGLNLEKDRIHLMTVPCREVQYELLLHKKQKVPHVINSCALTGEKPCINKAIHALLMQGYATFNMIVPGPQNCCHQEMCTALSQNEYSTWK